MPLFRCPCCREATIPLRDKYRLGWWLTTTCSNCGARLAAFPWTLMLLFFFYLWNVIWWFGLYHFNGGSHYFIYMVICWALLDLANIYLMPLCTLRRKAE